MQTFSSTTFLLARAAEISVPQWLSLVECCVGPRSWTGVTQNMLPFLDTGGRARPAQVDEL